MYTIKLMNEFLHGPIWIYDEEKMIRRTYPLITDDEILMRLNEDARKLFDECYSFDKNDEPCSFSEVLYEKNKISIAKIVQEIIARLNEVNDGSFEIVNLIEQ